MKGKPDDMRPTAVEDVTRRLIGKILANRLWKQASEIFRKENSTCYSDLYKKQPNGHVPLWNGCNNPGV